MGYRILYPLTIWFFMTIAGFGLAQTPQKAIATHETPIVGNGVTLGIISPGAAVVVLGESAAGEEFIVEQINAGGKKIVGMAAKKNLILTKETSEPAPAPQPPQTLPQMPPQMPRQPEFGAERGEVADVMSAMDFAAEAKADPALFKEKYQGQMVKVSGLVEKATMETQAGMAGTQPVVTLATSSGLPRVKLRLSPSIAKDSSIIAHYRYFPRWFYGYYGRKLEFRQSGSNQVQVRASYRYNSSNSSKYSTSWSPIFSPGDPLTAEGYVKGVGLDIELHGASLILPSKE